MANPDSYDEKYAKWNIEDLPIIPSEYQYDVAKATKKQFTILKKLMNDKGIDTVINACDAGREGESIFRLVYNEAKCKKKMKRLWISSMEDSAIKEGFDNLKDGKDYDNLFESAQARAIADWLVGMNISRLYSCLYKQNYSVGRVQTPTLSMIVKRDDEIANFKKEKYYTVELELDGFTLSTERIDSLEVAEQLKNLLENRIEIADVIQKEKIIKPDLPFDTPKAKTIQMFGSVFDLYSMKQAIEEGFILDVLKNYTHYENYYKIYKTIEDNPDFDKKKAQKKIRNYVEGQEFPIREKGEVMVNHFLANTVNKINGKAKAMIITQSILRAIEYYHIVSELLKNSNTGYEALVAFSGEKEYKGKLVTETSLNGFSDKETPEKFKQDKYKFLIVADKYQTGYDEPLLHTMYVDKVLNDVKAVQTLSRLNRSAKYKIDTCVIDFANEPEHILEAFQPYYKETKLEGETDPNKLHNLLSMLDAKYVYEEDEVDRLVDLFLKNSPRSFIDSIVDKSVERYTALSEEDQVEFKSGVKSFIRTYNFLASILPIGQVDWEKKVIFFEQLIHRLPTPEGDDLSAGILESVDLESYRLEKKNTIDIILEDEDGKVEGLGIGAGKKNEVELDTLENIVSTFNDIFGNIDWQDKDNVARQIKELPEMVMKNEKFKNALKNSDIENIKREYHSALKEVFRIIMVDNMELFGQWTNNSNFSKWLNDTIFDEIMKKNKR